MGNAKFENGVLVDSETGQPIGHKQGNTTIIDSSGAELKTLEDYGVMLPDFPDEEESNSGEDDDEDFKNFKTVGIRDSKPTEKQNSGSAKSSTPIAPSSHIDNGKTSYQVKRTKYEVTKDSYFIVKFCLLQKEDGRFVAMREEMVDDFPEAELHWVKFRMWNYEEELQWKSDFMEYDNSSKLQMINQDKLNEKKLKHLLLDWSFGECEDRLKLLHCDGILSDESYGIIMGMYPSIINTIVNLMNLVLENNQ